MKRSTHDMVLGIETSGHLTGAALVEEGGRLLGEVSIDLQASRQELLMEMIRTLLKEHRLQISDLSRIGVSLGPGSFTGLRVGLAAARALCLGADLPLVPVPTHQALAYPYRDLGVPILLLTGMRRGQICIELGRWIEDRWDALFPASSVPAETILNRIEPLLPGKDEGASPLLFLGEAVESGLTACPGLSPLGRMLIAPLSTTRRPAPVAFLAAREGERGIVGDEMERLAPIYLRSADARRPGNRG